MEEVRRKPGAVGRNRQGKMRRQWNKLSVDCVWEAGGFSIGES